MRTSSYEERIIQLLKEAGIKFVREYQPKDLRNGRYRFDFYINSLRAVIEVQGIQHYKQTKPFHKTKSDFTKAQERDRQKISYCLANDVQIFCVPYWDIINLHKASDIFCEQYLALSKYHNDMAWERYLELKEEI